ncbi:hypothetical protein ACWGJB_41590 [Streptomyces sp. NPDC054813]
MQSIEFWHYPRSEDFSVLLWGFRIDGKDLRVHVAGATRALWSREHEEETPSEQERFLLSQHDGLPVQEIDDRMRHFLGDPAPEFADAAGTTPVLGCSCGIWGCWPLLARITTTPATVTWSSFRQPFRKEWGELSMGPYVFARDRYEDALAEPARLVKDPLEGLNEQTEP